MIEKGEKRKREVDWGINWKKTKKKKENKNLIEKATLRNKFVWKHKLIEWSIISDVTFIKPEMKRSKYERCGNNHK